MSATPDRFTRYVIFLHPVDGVETSLDHIKAHVAHLRNLQQLQHLVMCGPFGDAPGGMIILQCADSDQAHRLAQADPFILSGVRRYDLRRWLLSCEENNHMGMG